MAPRKREDELPPAEPGLLDPRTVERLKGAIGLAAAGVAIVAVRSGRAQNYRHYTKYDRSKRPVLPEAQINTTYTNVTSAPPGSVINDQLVYFGDPDYPYTTDQGPVVVVRQGFG